MGVGRVRRAALAAQARAATAEFLQDPTGPVILGVFVIAVVLRLYLMARWHPAFVNYSDTGVYIQDAYEGGFSDPLRVVGYGIFLIPLHWLSPHMLPVVLLQHVMGLATAWILYLTVRRCGAPRLVALAGFAVVALGGMQIFLEHAILSETLFTFLVALALYACVRIKLGPPWWALLAGACVGLSVTVRGVGLILVPILALWVLFAVGRPNRAQALQAGAALAASLAVVGAYMVWRHAETGLSGLTTNGNWNFYGRVAPFADCTKFDPPQGTQGLCDRRPPDQRRREGWGVEAYIYATNSPAQQLFGPPFEVSDDPDANDKLGRFAWAAIRAQPGDYLDAVWQDLVRIVDPNHESAGDLSYDDFLPYLLHGNEGTDRNGFVEHWRQLYYPGDNYHWSDIGKLEEWERATRVQGPLMVLVLLLAAAAPLAAPRRARSQAILLTATACGLLIFPVLTHAYDARFVIPAFGPLFAAASLAAWGLLPIAMRGFRAAQRGFRR